MRVLKAHVENGRIVADEPVDLPDGTPLRVVRVDDGEEMSSEERAELESAIDKVMQISSGATSKMRKCSRRASQPSREGRHLEASPARRGARRLLVAQAS